MRRMLLLRLAGLLASLLAAASPPQVRSSTHSAQADEASRVFWTQRALQQQETTVWTLIST
jgi:uncharacterized protein (DUF2252 family)